MIYSTHYTANGTGFLIQGGFISIGLVISAVVCWIISDALSAVPVEHRRNMTPGQVWLLLIPLFNLVWNFFVFARVSDSFASYFESTGRPQPGDYGRQMGLAYAILSACSIIPCVGCFTGIAALVLLILVLVKFVGYKNLIIQGGGGAFPMQ